MKERIGHYRLLRELGSGAMGRVYLAYDERIERQVAVKELILPSGTGEAERREAVARFRREARAAGRLDHPNIVVVHSVEEEEGMPFIVMEYLEGLTLREILDREGRLPFERCLAVAGAVCEALHYAHSKGVIHRDIKPDNIFLLADGRVKVADFGIARLGVPFTATRAGDLIGTPGYMSPEQVKGEEVDHRTDIFSLGVVLYEMLTGKNPFLGESLAASMYRIVNLEPLPLSEFGLALPPWVQGVITRSLMKRRDLRYGDALQLREELLGRGSGMTGPLTSERTVVLAEAQAPGTMVPGADTVVRPGLPAAAPAAQVGRPVSLGGMTFPDRRRRGATLALVAVLTFLLAAAAAYLILRPGKGGGGTDVVREEGASGAGSEGPAGEGSAGAYIKADPGFAVYEDAAAGVAFQYPLDWKKDHRVSNSLVEFYAPLETAGDRYHEFVCVMVLDASNQPGELGKYCDKVVEEIEQTVEAATVLGVEEAGLGGIPARRITYEGKYSGLSMRWLQVVALKGDKAFVVIYTAERGSFETYRGQAEKTISSFTFL